MRGTPPRAWGKRASTSGVGLMHGTPPRAWGKRSRRASKFFGLPGTPPRAWGKPIQMAYDLSSSRYTPTGVGKTFSDMPDPSETYGTPPRAWGKRAQHLLRQRAVRYTPTGVGKTLLVVIECFRCSVHPHGRGENLRSLRAVKPHNGTPPRAWGKHFNAAPDEFFKRYTPTGVGKTSVSGAAPG